MSENGRKTDDILIAEHVRKEFGGLVATNDVDFTIPRGSVVSLIGPNGAGKTTFFNMLTGVYKPTGGRIVFDGHDVTGKPPHAITKLGIGRTFQNIRLFQQMTALENVLVGMHARLKGGIVGSIVRTPRIRREEAGARVRALELLDVHTYYGAIHALKGVSLEVREGEIVTLLGANGAGKSTTLRSINGLNHPRRGRIRFDGKDITRTAPHEVVKRGIAQSPE